MQAFAMQWIFSSESIIAAIMARLRMQGKWEGLITRTSNLRIPGTERRKPCSIEDIEFELTRAYLIAYRVDRLQDALKASFKFKSSKIDVAMGEADFLKVEFLRPDTHGFNLKVKVGSCKSHIKFSHQAVAPIPSMQHRMHPSNRNNPRSL